MNGLFLFGKQSEAKQTERERLRRQWELLSEREAELARSDTGGKIHMLPTISIAPNPLQPRKSFDDETLLRLADSIRQYGILQPLTVRSTSEDKPGGALRSASYEIIAGERRLRAAKLLHLPTVPCIVLDVDGKRSAELAIIENLQREDLNIFEEACAIAALADIFSLTQEQVARQLSTSQSCVANKLRLLRLTLPEREKILENGLSERHARALLRLDSAEKRLEAINYIAAKGLNVAATEAYIDRLICCEDAPSGEEDSMKRRLVLKDIRIFYNTVERAISTVRSAGVAIASDKRERGDEIEYVITIKK